MLVIDGSQGGGQVLRTATALSAITQKPFKIINIRGQREKPGLKPQHLAGVLAAKEICNAEVDAKLGSTELTFKPKAIKGGKYFFDTGTAGSITLVLQTIVPILAYAKEPSEVIIIGGTDVPWSPPIDYFKHIFCEYMKKLGIDIKVDILKRGFNPKGNGKIIIKIAPNQLKSFNITEQGAFKGIDLYAVSSESLKNKDVCERIVDSFIKNCPLENIRTKIFYKKTDCPSVVFNAHAHYENCKLGVDVLGEIGKSSESLGKECARKLDFEMRSKATVDQHMADQILIFLSLTNNSEFRTSKITDHTIANIKVIEQFLNVKFKINKNAIFLENYI